MITVQPLATGVGTGSPQTFTVPLNVTWVIKKAVFNNTTAGALTFTASLNDPTPREVITDHPLATLESYPSPELAGATLTAAMSFTIDAPAGITFWVSGLAVTQ